MKSLFRIILFVLCAMSGSSLHAAIVTWDGDAGDGLWSSATNWSGDATPAANDTVNISNGDTVQGIQFNQANLTINLSGNSTLTTDSTTVWRSNGTDLNVGAGSSLTGNFWDLDDGTLSFVDGAIATMNHWEQKDTNIFNFELSATGFTALTPNTFRLGNGSLTGDIANATYNVDLASYTGSTGIITLVDFAGDAAGMDNATFQGAGGLNILNAGSYVANLQWNDVNEAIELNVTATAVPEPSSFALLAVSLVACGLRRRRKRQLSTSAAGCS